jgi:hypothetical protein
LQVGHLFPIQRVLAGQLKEAFRAMEGRGKDSRFAGNTAFLALCLPIRQAGIPSYKKGRIF